ncbi:hypothetical protein [Streptomyces sp. NPDC014685]|uniref:hypothetical protein n=1 Tax=Streptomyces sp. NPDC014685 TaxID=3364881 RepID=UPI0036F95C43
MAATFETPLSSSPSQLPHEDAAAQAAAEAYRAAAYPAVPVHANRVYLCRQQGDAWPASA